MTAVLTRLFMTRGCSSVYREHKLASSCLVRHVRHKSTSEEMDQEDGRSSVKLSDVSASPLFWTSLSEGGRRMHSGDRETDQAVGEKSGGI